MKTNITEYTKEELAELQKLAEQARKQQERQRTQSLRMRVKTNLYIEKAKTAGITVTSEEIDEYIRKNPSTK